MKGPKASHVPSPGTFPFRYRGHVRYALGAEGLSILLRVTSRDHRPMPAGLGIHPYFPKHKGARLIKENPNRRNNMARAKSKADLEDELDDANDYIAELEGKLNDIVGIAADDDEDNSDDDSDHDSDDDDDDLD